MKKMLLFDIDGTLLLTGGAGLIAIEEAFFRVFGIKDTWRDLVPDGKTDPMIFEEIAARCLNRALSGIEYQELLQHYIEIFEREITRAPRFRLMPGITQLLSELSARDDVLLGVATGNVEDTARAKLRRAGLENHFAFGAFGSDSKERGELVRMAIERGRRHYGKDIPAENILVIGDSVLDFIAAEKAGVKCVIVTTGGTTREALAAYQPYRIFDNFAESKTFLEMLNGD